MSSAPGREADSGVGADAALETAATWEKAAYDELPDGVVVADEAATVVLVNRAAERLIDRLADECVGAQLTDVLPLTDAAGRDWWACTRPYDGLHIRTGQPERRLWLGRPGATSSRELLVTARYVRSGQRVVRVVVGLRDTAARERHERSRADLVSTVAHELRSPLTSVKGFTATLLAKWERFSDDQKRLMLHTVNADADRVTRLISELLDVSRIDSGRLELRRQVVDVPRAVQRIVDGRIASGEPAERFVIDAEPDLPEMWLDPDKIDQVLGNLVENAIRHGAGHVFVRVRRHTFPAAPGDGADDASPGGIEVSVSDEGEGIPEEVLPRIFTKFWRGTRRGSTGLGLYITKGIVEAHGGTIEVGRAPSGGALFRFVLPAGTPTFAV